MKRPRVCYRFFLLCGLVIALGACEAWADKPAPDLAAGKAAYQQSCARCHGVTGQGDGRDAKKLYPKPRVLTEGVYKFRTTASGAPPTDDDLFNTLTNGLPGSGMPDWKHLDESLRWQLVYYLKSLSPVFADSQPQLVPLGHDPGAKQADLKTGRHIYEKLGCVACHGPEGRGDGPSSGTMVDNWNHAIRPANLTQGWNYRGGSDPQAIVARVLTGIDGTPMPSYAEAASPEDVWQLAYYVRSLQREPKWNMIVHAARVEGALPASPSDARWETAERGDLRMRNAFEPGSGEITGAQSIGVVSYQAVYNEDAISVRVSWSDPTESRQPADVDAASAGATAPNVGDAMAVVFHSADVAGDVATLHTWPMLDSPPLDLLVWSAQRDHTSEAVAHQYDELLTGKTAGAARASQAVYEHGQWSVVITRPLRAADMPHAAGLAVGEFVPVAFVVWDGGNLGQRAVSTWVDVALGSSAHEGHANTSAAPAVVMAISAIALVIGLVLLIKKP